MFSCSKTMLNTSHLFFFDYDIDMPGIETSNRFSGFLNTVCLLSNEESLKIPRIRDVDDWV